MRRLRFTVPVILVVLACLVAGPITSRPKPLAASVSGPDAPTPGQLSIVDDKGKVVGLCPLRHTDVQASIAGYVSRVTVKQQFHNPSKEPIEAVYTFPLPGDAAVDDMTMTIGTRVIKAEIKRREEARRIYDTAKAAGQGAALLDQERTNIFTQWVANIMPGENVDITISYVNLLNYDSGQYEWVFPMVVGPLYTPTGGYSVPGQRGAPSSAERPSGTDAIVNDAEKITPPIAPPGVRAGHDISVTVQLDAGLPVRDIKAQLHDVDIKKDSQERATIRLRDSDKIPNKDFILRYSVAGKVMQAGLIASPPADGNGYFSLIVQPPAAAQQRDPAPREIVFVIDQTGSQSGLPIRKAKETMRYLVQNMNPGDSFQLLGFTTEVYPCFNKPVHNTPENVARALQFLEPIEGRGGTDIYKAVDFALKQQGEPNRQRIVCYLTDGFVGNVPQILGYIKEHVGKVHMFPFGIGNSVNRELIDGMAKEGHGIAEYVDLKASAEESAARFYRRIAKPLLTDIKVEWNGLPVQDVFPAHIPDIFLAGRPTILKGRYTKAAAGELVLRGQLNGEPWIQRVPVNFGAQGTANGAAMPTIWAREKIEALQSQDYMGAQTGNGQPNITEQIIAVALEYRLMSRWTSFVAVEKRVVNIGGKQRLVDVPVELPDGMSHEGIFGERSGDALFYGARGGRLEQRLSAIPAPGIAGAIPPAAFAGGGNGVQGPAGPTGATGATGAPGPSTLSPLSIPGFTSQSVRAFLMDDSAALDNIYLDADIARGTAEGEKKLAVMTPDQRRQVLALVKLARPLWILAGSLKNSAPKGAVIEKNLPPVVAGKIEVQVWLNRLPPDGLAKLKAAGFDLVATLTKEKLLLGSIAVEKLDALIALPFVRLVEPPQIK